MGLRDRSTSGLGGRLSRLPADAAAALADLHLPARRRVGGAFASAASAAGAVTHLADELSDGKRNRPRGTVLEQLFYRQVGRALLDHADFLGAAPGLAVARGISAVTVASLTER